MLRRRIKEHLDWIRGPLQPKLLVSGMPKAGTTALAMLLGAAAGYRVVSDPFYSLDKRGVEFRDRLYGGSLSIDQLMSEHRAVFRGDLIKDPNFVFFASDLLARFPDAGFAFIVRDPRANIRSILNRLDLPGRPLPERGLSRVPETWRRVLEGRTPDLPCDDYLRCAALRWRLAAHTYLEYRDTMILVRYEDFNRDKPSVIGRVLAERGIQNPRPIEHLMDRQFQPPGMRNVDWGEFFGDEGLRTIDAICRSEMEFFGYRVGQRSGG